ncbi:MAG: CBS domain-containing protein [Solirubrobacteraceae bacterium]
MSSSASNILDSVRAGDCMRAGIFTCDPETPGRELAATMASLRIHALALRGAPSQTPAIISDLDVVAGIASHADQFTARDLASAQAVTVSRTRTLREAAHLMVEHGAAHLIVIDHASGHPVGVLSSTDILQAFGAGVESAA